MIKKHILPLTYGPKIQPVIDGTCTQTIRPLNPNNPKNIGDYIMFHGWEGKPRHSKWSFRTPYWKIIEVIDVYPYPDVLSWFDDSEVQHYSTITESDAIAVLDLLSSYDELYELLCMIYGENRLKDHINPLYFQIIRWNPNKKLEKSELI